jgi:hypothetical protein
MSANQDELRGGQTELRGGSVAAQQDQFTRQRRSARQLAEQIGVDPAKIEARALGAGPAVQPDALRRTIAEQREGIRPQDVAVETSREGVPTAAGIEREALEREAAEGVIEQSEAAEEREDVLIETGEEGQIEARITEAAIEEAAVEDALSDAPEGVDREDIGVVETERGGVQAFIEEERLRQLATQDVLSEAGEGFTAEDVAVEEQTVAVEQGEDGPVVAFDPEDVSRETALERAQQRTEAEFDPSEVDTVQRRNIDIRAEIRDEALAREAREQALSQLPDSVEPERVTVTQTEEGFQAEVQGASREQVVEDVLADAPEGIKREDVTVEETGDGLEARVSKGAIERELREDVVRQSDLITSPDETVVFETDDGQFAARPRKSVLEQRLKEQVVEESEFADLTADVAVTETDAGGFEAEIRESAIREGVREQVVEESDEITDIDQTVAFETDEGAIAARPTDRIRREQAEEALLEETEVFDEGDISTERADIAISESGEETTLLFDADDISRQEALQRFRSRRDGAVPDEFQEAPDSRFGFRAEVEDPPTRQEVIEEQILPEARRTIGDSELSQSIDADDVSIQTTSGGVTARIDADRALREFARERFVEEVVPERLQEDVSESDVETRIEEGRVTADLFEASSDALIEDARDINKSAAAQALREDLPGFLPEVDLEFQGSRAAGSTTSVTAIATEEELEDALREIGGNPDSVTGAITVTRDRVDVPSEREDLIISEEGTGGDAEDVTLANQDVAQLARREGPRVEFGAPVKVALSGEVASGITGRTAGDPVQFAEPEERLTRAERTEAIEAAQSGKRGQITEAQQQFLDEAGTAASRQIEAAVASVNAGIDREDVEATTRFEGAEETRVELADEAVAGIGRGPRAPARQTAGTGRTEAAIDQIAERSPLVDTPTEIESGDIQREIVERPGGGSAVRVGLTESAQRELFAEDLGPDIDPRDVVVGEDQIAVRDRVLARQAAQRRADIEQRLFARRAAAEQAAADAQPTDFRSLSEDRQEARIESGRVPEDAAEQIAATTGLSEQLLTRNLPDERTVQRGQGRETTEPRQQQQFAALPARPESGIDRRIEQITQDIDDVVPGQISAADINRRISRTTSIRGGDVGQNLEAQFENVGSREVPDRDLTADLGVLSEAGDVSSDVGADITENLIQPTAEVVGDFVQTSESGAAVIGSAPPGSPIQRPTDAEIQRQFRDITRGPEEDQSTISAGEDIGQGLTSGVGLVLNVPATAGGFVDLTEVGVRGAQEFQAGRGEEFATDVRDVAAVRGARIGQAATENPLRVGAQVGGSVVGSFGAIRGAQRVGGPRTAKAVSTAIQPGEEVAITAARRGLVRPSIAETVPGVPSSAVRSDVDPDVVSRVRERLPSADVRSRVEAGAKRARSVGPRVGVEARPTAGRVEIDPDVRPLRPQAEDVEAAIRGPAATVRRGGEAVAERVRGGVESVRSRAAQAANVDQVAGDVASQIIEEGGQRAPTSGVATQQAFIRGSEVPAPTAEDVVGLTERVAAGARELPSRVARTDAATRVQESVLDRVQRGIEATEPGAREVALQQTFTRGADFPTGELPEVSAPDLPSPAQRTFEFFEGRGPAVSGDVARQQAFTRGSDPPSPTLPVGPGDAARRSVAEIEESFAEFALRGGQVTPSPPSDARLQQTFIRGSEFPGPDASAIDVRRNVPAPSDVVGRVRSEATAARFRAAEARASTSHLVQDIRDLTITIGEPAPPVRRGETEFIDADIDDPLGIGDDIEGDVRTAEEFEADADGDGDASPATGSTSIETGSGVALQRVVTGGEPETRINPGLDTASRRGFGLEPETEIGTAGDVSQPIDPVVSQGDVDGIISTLAGGDAEGVDLITDRLPGTRRTGITSGEARTPDIDPAGAETQPDLLLGDRGRGRPLTDLPGRPVEFEGGRIAGRESEFAEPRGVLRERPETRVEPRTELRTELRQPAQEVERAEARVESRTETRQATRGEARQETRVEARLEAGLETRPRVEPEIDREDDEFEPGGDVDVFLAGGRERAAATTDPGELLTEGAFEAGALEAENVDLGVTAAEIDVEGNPSEADLAEVEDVLREASDDSL